MRVEVRLKGWLAGRLPGGHASVEVAPGTTALGIMDALHVPAGACIFIRNGEVATYDTPLEDGDRLDVAMMAAGG